MSKSEISCAKTWSLQKTQFVQQRNGIVEQVGLFETTRGVCNETSIQFWKYEDQRKGYRVEIALRNDVKLDKKSFDREHSLIILASKREFILSNDIHIDIDIINLSL
jgi:hypothetical protein